jgi:vacuolar-type H+-ATPase subunit F/Vma7
VSEVAAIGEPARVSGFALAGARVYPVDDVRAILAAWQGLPESVAVVILTPAAAESLDDRRTALGAPLTVVMPE